MVGWTTLKIVTETKSLTTFVTHTQGLRCVRSSTADVLDLQLVDVIDKVFVVPQSVVGVLFLQTHFPPENWDALTKGAVVLKHDNAQTLLIDARSAGLIVKDGTA